MQSLEKNRKNEIQRHQIYQANTIHWYQIHLHTLNYCGNGIRNMEHRNNHN